MTNENILHGNQFERTRLVFILGGLGKMIFFLSEGEVVFPKFKLVVFNSLKMFFIDRLVFRHLSTEKSKNNIDVRNGVNYSNIVHKPFSCCESS